MGAAETEFRECSTAHFTHLQIIPRNDSHKEPKLDAKAIPKIAKLHFRCIVERTIILGFCRQWDGNASPVSYLTSEASLHEMHVSQKTHAFKFALRASIMEGCGSVQEGIAIKVSCEIQVLCPNAGTKPSSLRFLWEPCSTVLALMTAAAEIRSISQGEGGGEVVSGRVWSGAQDLLTVEAEFYILGCMMCSCGEHVKPMFDTV